MLAALLSAASAVATFNCTLDKPQSLHVDANAATLTTITFPDIADDDWTFEIDVRRGDAIKVAVVWPTDPLQIAGEFQAVNTAKGAIAFAAASSGPCTFTEQGCVTTVQLVEQPDGRAKLSLLPSALATDRETDTRKPFIAIAEGICLPAGDRK